MEYVIRLVLLFVYFGTSQCLCPDGWVYFRGSCYLFAHDGKSHTEAEHFCTQLKSHLVKIETKDENTFLKSFSAQLIPYPRWIGLIDSVIEGLWQWTDGTSVEFTDWHPGKPDGKNSNCAALWVGFNYTWADEPCVAPFHPICERPESAGSMVIG